jgi:serine/threonine-protein kinase
VTAKNLLGKTLGPYTIKEILGSGGMAVVYRATGPDGKTVALKVLFPPPGTEAEILVRFEREARTTARLNHPSIVRVVDVGHAHDHAYLAMNLIEGENLTTRLARIGKFNESIAIDIIWQIADALYYAHSQGVVHRDVKPSNILLTSDNHALLTDFGVAQALDDTALTRSGHTVGTPAYMAPEQATGRVAVDGRADLYSLGVVLYQMVTGRVPFEGSTPQILHAHVYDLPPAPSTMATISPGLESVILKAMAKNVSERFQTGAAMAQALTMLDDQTTLQLPTTPISPEITPQRIPPVYVWAIGAILVAIAAIGGRWWFTQPADRPTATALSQQVNLPPSSTPAITPTRKPNPPAPSATPTEPEVTEAPTPTPLPTKEVVEATPTTCVQPLDEALSGLNQLTLNEPLGCPRAESVTTPGAWQPFENGLMLWRADSNLIYTIGPDEAWFYLGDQWREGDDPYDPSIIVPSGYYQPVRGFGKVWRNRPGVRADLGWALTEEVALMVIIQEFTDGQVWHSPEQDRFMILYNSGNYQIIQGGETIYRSPKS